MKLKAGTLFIVLIVSFVIALLMSALIYYAYLNRLLVFEHQLDERLIRNANSGINIVLSTNGIEEGSTSIDLFNDETDSVQLQRKQWGVFDIGIVRAFSGTHAINKVFQYGVTYPTNERLALYLTDQDRPLSISGSTLIKGNVFLPKAGIRSTYINGKPYERDKLVDGNQQESEKNIKPLNVEIKEKLQVFLKADSTLLLEYPHFVKRINNHEKSFYQPTQLIVLSQKKSAISSVVKGNVIIFSKGPLFISSSAIINDALIFAPAIEIENGFNGNLQAFVTDSLKIGKDCTFNYPTALGLLKKENDEGQPFIRIGENSLINGMLFSDVQSQDLKQTMVELKKGSSVNGILYVNGFLNLLGNVRGTTYCNRFVLKTPITYYENHLLDVQLDVSRLSKYFVSSPLFGNDHQKGVIKWLY